jgi:CysZ protein
MKKLSLNNTPLFAINCFFKGLFWLSKAQLRPFLLVPLLINLVLYSTALVLGYFYLNTVISHLIPAWLHWLSWLLYPLFFICAVIVGFFSFTVLANLIASPFYGKLAEKTAMLIAQQNNQEQTVGMPVNHHWTHVMLGELKRISYLLKWMLLLTIISIIPGLNLISPLLWALFGAWACALEYLAYPLENKGLLFLQQKDLIGSVRFSALSFGSVVMLGLGLPVFNLLVSPAAVIGATLYTEQLAQAEENTA